ncbi:MAG: beta-galactosidase trimerization domain-containing protein, partial [Planctomycetota bacterium]|nr:beta-galactosidase trimerization domain-containing protein [Planctomycetota bacterium]
MRYELRDPWGNRIRQVPNSVEISPPGGQVTIPLVRLHANGLYRIDLWLLRDGKIENWGYTAIQVEGGATLHVERKIGSPAKSRFRILTDTAGILRVIATDDMDRVFHEFSHGVSRTGDHEIVVDMSRSCLPRNRVSFTLFNGKESIVLARKVHDLYIPRIGLGSMKGEYMLASYGSTTCEPHVARYLGALYREAGLNTIYLNWHHRTYIRDNAANLGLFNITGSSWVMRQFDLNKDLKLSPNKPEVRAGFQQKIIQAVNDVQTYGGVGRVLDDETWFAYTKYERGEMRGAQADQSEPSLELFREAMQKKYQAIARLNEAWGTSFQSFETMKPIEENMIRGLAPPPYTWDETKDGKPVFVVEDNPSGWLEFRQYMNWTFANRYYAWVTEQHQKDLGEDYAAGCGAPHWATKGNPTYRGGDMAELKKVMKFMMLYGGSSEAYPDAFVGQPGAQKYDPPLNWQQFGSWYHLFTGADALWFYYGHAMIGSEIAWRQHAVWLKQATEDIRSGAGALIRDAQPLNRQVRVLYSGENLAMQWLFAKRKDTWKALAKDRTQSTLNKVLSDDFIRGSPVTAVDIRKGDLKDCRLLILPLAFCMDDATAAAIREYVRGGGCVVADLLPGIRNRFGKVRARGALSEIFGVKQGD